MEKWKRPKRAKEAVHTVVTPGTSTGPRWDQYSTDRGQLQYSTGPLDHQKKRLNARGAFSVTQKTQHISSSILTLVFGAVSCRNHTEINPILSRGVGIELVKLTVCNSS